SGQYDLSESPHLSSMGPISTQRSIEYRHVRRASFRAQMKGQDLVLRRILVTTAAVPSNEVVGIIRSTLGSCKSIRLSPGLSNRYVERSFPSGRLCRWARGLSLLGMLMLRSSGADAHEIITTKITWAREISRVFSRRCLSCHRNGGPAFDLSSYQQ